MNRLLDVLLHWIEGCRPRQLAELKGIRGFGSRRMRLRTPWLQARQRRPTRG